MSRSILVYLSMLEKIYLTSDCDAVYSTASDISKHSEESEIVSGSTGQI